MSKRTAPKVNAGSMADIAFLLLIFFLVTTTIDKDKGILRQLPKHEITPSEVDMHERNVLEIIINNQNKILVDNTLLPISQLSLAAIAFIDNGGASITSEQYCDYCLGERDITSSDHPAKAVISISPDRESSYKTYIAVQNELNKAYNILRNKASQQLFQYDYTVMSNAINNGHVRQEIAKIKGQLKTIKELYPMIISEAKTKKDL